MKMVSVSQMQAIEEEANRFGLTYDQMMLNAGKGIAYVIDATYQKEKSRKIMGLVGSGNNGGDTLIALEILQNTGWQTTAYIVKFRRIDDPHISKLSLSGGAIVTMDQDSSFSRLRNLVEDSLFILDGILGTGFHLPLKPDIADLLNTVNEIIEKSQNRHIVIAVDCPSGVNCDTGETALQTIKANLTITMAAIKQGIFQKPAYNYIGEVKLIDIGIPIGENVLKSWEKISWEIPEDSLISDWLPNRPIDSHKGTFGTSLIIAGSKNYVGAALLAGEAAYRIGSGLVTLAIPNEIHHGLAGYLPEATWLLLPDKNGHISVEANEDIQKHINNISALLIGPGLGLDTSTQQFISRFIESIESSDIKNIPLIIDADGLKLFSKIPDWHKKIPPLSILTPHPGEMAYLTGLSREDIQTRRNEIVQYYSKKWGHIVILKGAYTVIASPNEQYALIPIASPALARAGTGDVLAGLITGLRAQGINSFESAVIGAYIHGRAGILATQLIGNTASVIARDILTASAKILSILYSNKITK
jgi:hydroxyethylthiazole kinase-like uncharacterized protein yjeF